MSHSKHFNSKQIKALDKLGDLMAPGDIDFPSFSKLKVSEHIDMVLDTVTPEDLEDLKLLFTVLSFLPSFAIGLFVSTIELLAKIPGSIGALPRMIMLGLKGIVMSLYYSGLKGEDVQSKNAHEVIGFGVSVYTDDLKKTDNSFKRNTDHGLDRF